ncbi:ATPase [Streptomyces sp. AJS327]|uniref:N-acetylglucosamine kinase n=1 Tax=Streptomyces sp. AJS327 TaxID=2545265 RepID=UPI0015DF7DD9|nr:BadF/BadG/BcrA/BcrD ATPase family protein [Streptomyces sp. AJS327]MBA0052531.1 ATPase [Streptomyces sp. AJS327]
MRRPEPEGEPGWVLGVDSGGSGLRVALARADGSAVPSDGLTRDLGEPVRTGPRGIEPAAMLGRLLPAARALLTAAGSAGPPVAVCVGAAGMATLGEGLRAELPGAFARELDVRRLALAADGVTAYAGALGEAPGAVVAAGTGMIAMGTDLRAWRRADGWGHLLGDCGGGAWIGRAGLEAAMRAADGREGGSAALRERAEAVFGAPLSELPGQLYPRQDRPAVLASFAPEVARCAPRDAVAAGVLRAAGREIARSAAAVCPPGEGARVALTGGLFRLGEGLLGPVREELAARLPLAREVPSPGDPLRGALLVADRLARGTLVLPRDRPLLTVAAHLTSESVL